MPKAQIPVGSARIEAIGSYGPATWANVFYAVPTTVDAAHLQDVAALLAQQTAILYGPGGWGLRTSVNVALEKVRVVFRDAEDSVYRATIADAVYGSVAGGLQAANVSYLIDWQTGDPRKGGKPRTYAVGVPDSDMLDSSRVVAAAVADINTNLIAWIEANLTAEYGTAHGCVFGEMSFVNGKADRTVPLFYPFIGATTSSVVATQRRRVDRLRT